MAAHQHLLPQQGGRQAGLAGAGQHSGVGSDEVPYVQGSNGVPLSGKSSGILSVNVNRL